MCFALPLRVKSTSQSKAVMEDGRQVNLAMVGQSKKGQWLLVQSNLAVDRLTQAEARAMRSAIKEATSNVVGDFHEVKL